MNMRVTYNDMGNKGATNPEMSNSPGTRSENVNDDSPPTQNGEEMARPRQRLQGGFRLQTSGKPSSYIRNPPDLDSFLSQDSQICPNEELKSDSSSEEDTSLNGDHTDDVFIHSPPANDDGIDSHSNEACSELINTGASTELPPMINNQLVINPENTGNTSSYGICSEDMPSPTEQILTLHALVSTSEDPLLSQNGNQRPDSPSSEDDSLYEGNQGPDSPSSEDNSFYEGNERPDSPSSEDDSFYEGNQRPDSSSSEDGSLYEGNQGPHSPSLEDNSMYEGNQGPSLEDDSLYELCQMSPLVTDEVMSFMESILTTTSLQSENNENLCVDAVKYMAEVISTPGPSGLTADISTNQSNEGKLNGGKGKLNGGKTSEVKRPRGRPRKPEQKNGKRMLEGEYEYLAERPAKMACRRKIQSLCTEEKEGGPSTSINSLAAYTSTDLSTLSTSSAYFNAPSLAIQSTSSNPPDESVARTSSGRIARLKNNLSSRLSRAKAKRRNEEIARQCTEEEQRNRELNDESERLKRATDRVKELLIRLIMEKQLPIQLLLGILRE